MSSFMKLMRQVFRRDKPEPSAPLGQWNDENPLSEDLQKNIDEVNQVFGDSSDLVIRMFHIGLKHPIQGALIYISGMTEARTVDHILESLMVQARGTALNEATSEEWNKVDLIKQFSLVSSEVEEFEGFPGLLDTVLSGDTVILFEGHHRGLAAGTKGWKDRGVTEPSTQTVVRGPREGFSEPIRINTSLIRRRIKDPRLRLETRAIGRVTRTDVSIMYIAGIADEKVVQEVRSRLERIDIDGILESGYIEELIQDSTVSPFPTVFNSERPDVVAANLLEGRVAILIDGTPFVLVVPAVFIQFFQAAEDYYHRFDYGLIRALRVLSFIIGLLLPGLYIALTTFHQEMIPTLLLLSLASQVEGIPFPAFFEALIMEVTFEVLREAGIRMPRAVGSAISIVGALVLGDAAVSAGLVSPAMVIVVSLTAIANFVTPSFNMSISIRMMRFAFMILAALFGLFGITVGVIALVLHLCHLNSFGVPYMAPLAPLHMSDQKDTFFRFPIWAMFSRPRMMRQRNVIRENNPAPRGKKRG